MGSAWGISFADTGIKRGIQVYGGYVDAREIDVTNLTETGIHAKRNGFATCRDFTGTFDPTTPADNTSSAYYATEGAMINFFDDDITLAAGARRHHGRFGGKTIWSRQAFALVGEVNSEELRQNTCFKIGLSENYSTFTSTSEITLPFNAMHINNSSGPSYSGVDTANNRILISPFSGTYRVDASIRVQYNGAWSAGDAAPFSLLVKNGDGDVVAQNTAVLYKSTAGATHQTIQCAGYVKPTTSQQARFTCAIVDASGLNNIVVQSAAETFLSVATVGA